MSPGGAGKGRFLVEDASAPGTGIDEVVYPAAAGATVLAVALYYLGAALQSVAIRFVAVPLFTRLERGEVLDNPKRQEIIECIRAEPGVHLKGLAAKVACGNGTLQYHLEVLTREGFVTRVESGRFTRYFVAGSLPHGEMRKHATLLAGSHERLFRIVSDRPGVTQLELAGLAGLSPGAVHYAVAKLEADGLVKRVPAGRSMELYASPPPMRVAN